MELKTGGKTMTQKEQLEKALDTLRQYILLLAEQAGESKEHAELLWEGIRKSEGLLQELAYYHDYGELLCKYQIGGYTLADVLVWQVDHFKLYMDRPDDMNRYRQPRLILSAFDTMVRMETAPEQFRDKMHYETGQDIL